MFAVTTPVTSFDGMIVRPENSWNAANTSRMSVFNQLMVIGRWRVGCAGWRLATGIVVGVCGRAGTATGLGAGAVGTCRSIATASDGGVMVASAAGELVRQLANDSAFPSTSTRNSPEARTSLYWCRSDSVSTTRTVVLLNCA